MSRKSAVNVIDAKTMSSDPVAVVELPHRVPYGFHAFFVTEVSYLDSFVTLSPLPSLLLKIVALMTVVWLKWKQVEL